MSPRLSRITILSALVVTALAGTACSDLFNNLFNPSSTSKSTTDSSATSGFRVSAVTAGVDIATYTGACPKTLTFTGTITATEAGAVTYKWERSDGSASPIGTMTFAAGGAQTVSETRALTVTTTGWERLHVLTPNDLQSNQATFLLVCTGS
jgi:hypothetical protein